MRVTADTNVLVRAFVLDDPTRSPAAIAALQNATVIVVTVPTLGEFVWVLCRAYRRSPAEVIRRLLATDTVVADRPVIEERLAFMDAGGDFAEGVIAASRARDGRDGLPDFR